MCCNYLSSRIVTDNDHYLTDNIRIYLDTRRHFIGAVQQFMSQRNVIRVEIT